MERTARDGGQFSSGDRPNRSYGASRIMVPRFVRRWAFVTKRSPAHEGACLSVDPCQLMVFGSISTAFC